MQRMFRMARHIAVAGPQPREGEQAQQGQRSDGVEGRGKVIER